jgi:2-iminobutanoate/2-iminopropanoate deaminase
MQSIFTPDAPKPIGPYSQAVRVGEWLFISGQIPLDPEQGVRAAGGVGAQAERVLLNLAAVLQAVGGTLADVVKTTVYLTHLKDFTEVNQVYARHFQEPFPARAVVQAAALPAGADIEIEAVAFLGKNKRAG